MRCGNNIRLKTVSVEMYICTPTQLTTKSIHNFCFKLTLYRHVNDFYSLNFNLSINIVEVYFFYDFFYFYEFFLVEY